MIATICAPLEGRQRLRGAIQLRNKRSGNFTLDDAQLLGAVAEQAAVALENAELYTDADIALDCRFLPNPFFVEDLRPKTGIDEAVAQYVLDRDDTREFLRRVEDLLEFTLPRYQREGKSYLTIAIGCTGGRHRSVALVEELRRRLEAQYFGPGALQAPLSCPAFTIAGTERPGTAIVPQPHETAPALVKS